MSLQERFHDVWFVFLSLLRQYAKTHDCSSNYNCMSVGNILTQTLKCENDLPSCVLKKSNIVSNCEFKMRLSAEQETILFLHEVPRKHMFADPPVIRLPWGWLGYKEMFTLVSFVPMQADLGTCTCSSVLLKILIRCIVLTGRVCGPLLVTPKWWMCTN